MTRIKGELGSAIFGILSVTDEEQQAVSDRFLFNSNILETPYFVRNNEAGNLGNLTVVYRKMATQTNLNSALDVGQMLEDFKPEFILLIGTAGGHSDRNANLGDVLVANFIDNSNYWKHTKGRTVLRKVPHDHPSSHLLTGFAEPLIIAGDWTSTIKANRPSAGISKAFLGNLVSGDRLLGDPGNREQQRIMKFFDKACAFEMEAFGVSYAIYRARKSVHYNPQFLIIRGISDLVNANPQGNQEDRILWTPYAASAAAEFAFQVVNRVLKARKSEELGV